METMQKVPTNSESNIMRCSTVPRFKYLPIRWSALSFVGIIIYSFVFINAYASIFVFYGTFLNFNLQEFCLYWLNISLVSFQFFI